MKESSGDGRDMELVIFRLGKLPASMVSEHVSGT